MMEVVNKRYEFVLLFDVENGNPNGDPDAGNMPRIDVETGHGIVTDVCLKRKIRNYIDVAMSGNDGYDIYVRESAVLNNQHRKAYAALKLEPNTADKKLPKEKKDAEAVTAFMCQHFFDIRAFGAVMSTEVNCGQVRGPVQLSFARSIDPIVQQEIAITRMAVTSERDAAKKDRERGRKHIVPYALYRVEGFVSAHLAAKTAFNMRDLDLLWNALMNMFDHDRSAARGKMAARKLIIFEHDTALGCAPAYRLFDLIEVARKNSDLPARSYRDYLVGINGSAIPSGVTVHEK